MRTQLLKEGHIFLWAAVMLGIAGCLDSRLYRLPGDRFFLKNPKLTVIPGDAASYQDSGIDFSANYTWERIRTSHGRTYTSYHHFLFWPSGECVRIVTLDRHPDKYDIEGALLKEWSMGFYRVTGTNIAMEVASRTVYNRYYGTISSNGIHITRTGLKYSGARFHYSDPACEHYVRYPRAMLSVQPDWSPAGMPRRASVRKDKQ